MDKLIKIYESIYNENHVNDFFDQYGDMVGASLVETEEIGNYTIFLIKQLGNYSIGLTSGDRPLWTPNDQKRHFPSLESSIDWAAFRKMLGFVRKWLAKYGRLTVGSYDQKKNEKYKKILSLSGFNVQDANHFGVPSFDILPD